MKDIPGFEGLYAVTEDGRVWSHPKTSLVGNNGGIKTSGNRWLTQTPVTKRTTHLRVYLHAKGKTTGMLVHRAVALTYLPNPHGFPHINHKDGNPTNNSLDNLEWCDAAMNAKHAVANGLTKMPSQRGSANSGAKVDEADVRAMRTLHTGGESCAAIARRYNLTPKAAWNIVHDKRWGHVIPE